VPIDRANEIGSLADSFNRLSDRMEALRSLLTRLEQGADLESTLRTLSESLPTFMPVDWIGVLAVGADGRIHLERAYSDGAPAPLGKLSFDPDRTLLAECIENRSPLHIADVRQMATLSDRYVFLSRLAELGRRDAIFLPIGTPQQVQGVVVFANRYPNSYRSDHLALLRNLGVLLGVTLGRTLQLVENQRLASIGQFASGIAHEIRNPLATINLALEHLAGLTELPPGAAQRVTLASQEVARLERLLADILLYARPLTLDRKPSDLGALIEESAARWPDRIDLVMDTKPVAAEVDPDRVRQVLINLFQNAIQANTGSAGVRVEVRLTGRQWVEIEISNGGEPIPPRILDRLFEPFVTTKRDGTGLGLAIVRRIVAAHGGDIQVTSSAGEGTRVVLRLPSAQQQG
jgi:signal transduction histidine kinase